MQRLALAPSPSRSRCRSVAAGARRFVPNDPLVAKQWYLAQIHAFDFWPDTLPRSPPSAWPWSTRGSTWATRSSPAAIALAQSFVGGDVTDRAGPRHVRRGDHRGGDEQRRGDRRDRLPRPAAGRQGRPLRRHDLAGGGGEGDPLGGRQRRARDQPLPRRPARPADATEDTYSRGRAERDRVRVLEGAVVVAAVGNGDEAPKTPVAARQLPGGAPARARGERARRRRLGAGASRTATRSTTTSPRRASGSSRRCRGR